MPEELTAEVEGFQLSPQQDRLWLLQAQGGEPGDAGPYRAVGLVEVAGELQPAALREAAHHVVARHEILRTAFRCLPGMTTPLQVVVPDATPAWESVGLLGPTAQDEEVARLFAAERERPFDLTTGAALRVTHVALGPRAHHLLLSLPALCADAPTLDALTAELARAYAACRADEADDEADKPLQYARLAAWQTELLNEADAEQREVWRRRSALSLSALAPLGEQKQVAAGPFRPAAFSIQLGRETLQRARAAAAAHGTSVEVFLLACWQTQLWRLTGVAEFVVGYLTCGRPFEELRGAPGLLARWLPLAVQFAAATSFGALLRQTHQAVAEAENAQAAFIWPHSGRHEPAAGDFPACGFEFDGEFAAHAAGGPTFRLRRWHVGVDRAKLTLVCAVEADALRAELRYDPAHFTGATVERLAAQYATLLSSATAEPSAPAAELEMLGEAERRQLLVGWNETGADYDTRACLHQLFEAQATRTPDRVAAVYEEQQLTYAELDARANQLAHYLRRAGVGPEVLVGVCVDRSLDLLVGLLGVLKAGGAYVPLDPEYPQERRDYMQRDAGVAVLLTQQQLLGLIPATDAQVLCLDSDWASVAAEPAESPRVAVGADNLVYVIYTSGSTGRPKGAMLHHRGIVNCVAWMQATYRLDETDRFLLKTSLSFDPSVWEIFWPLAVGACVVVARPGGHRDAGYLAGVMARRQVTSAYFVPSMLRVMLDEPALAECRALRRVICGGEALPVETMRRFHAELGAELHHSYGPTETSIAATEWTCAPDAARVTMGRPLANTTLYVLAARLRPVPMGVPGELYVGGDGVGRGYLGRADLTAAAFIPDPFAATPGARLYKTGDLVRYLPDGMIEFLARTDEQVKVRGFRIELGEIEVVLSQHPAVREAVVAIKGEVSGEKQLAAYVVCEPEQTATPGELRDHVKDKLPEYMVPQAFVLLDELPLNANGKVDRSALPAPDRSRSGIESAYNMPRTPVEEVMAGIWSDVLGVERVGTRDNFFDLGGHSLLATQLMSRIREAFGVEVALRELFERPTLWELGERVEAARRTGEGAVADEPPMVRVEREAGVVLSFAQQRLWFLDQLEPGSPLYNCPGAAHLQGELNVEALEASLNRMIERHESLRTTFAAVDGQPVQVIGGVWRLRLEVEEVSQAEGAAREAEVSRRAEAEARHSFNLAEGPLLRVRLLRLAPDEHVVFFTMHHIISDAWSLVVFLNELAALYEWHRGGARAELPGLEIQYADYAAWQRARMSGAALEAELGYWRVQLAGAPPVLELPADRPRPAEQTYGGGQLEVKVGGGEAARLRALSRREGVTLFMTLLAAFDVLLHYYTGREDIVVGTNVANRTRRETEHLIGFFINQLPIRTNLAGDPTFQELLRRVRDVTLDAYAYQDVPFDRLVEALKPERHLSHTPLFQVKIDLLSMPLPDIGGGELTVTPLKADIGGSHLDLIISLAETQGELSGLLFYNSDQFDATTVTWMFKQFEAILAHVATRPDAKLSALTVLLAENDKRRARSEEESFRESQSRKLKNLRRSTPSVHK